MVRYKMTIEYVGTNFKGWQRQVNGHTVQQVLEDTLRKLTKQPSISVQGAGRTDTGVHALGQVAHFDLSTEIDVDKLQYSLNHFLRFQGVIILSLSRCESDFDARFNATKRHYIYRIVNRTAPLVIEVERAWWLRRKLNIDLLNQAAAHLIGYHDFTSFRAKMCQAIVPYRTVEQLYFTQINHQEIQLRIVARSYLHHMVRNIVGTLVPVGYGDTPPQAVQQILDAKDRRYAGVTAPAYGLYLSQVEY